MNRAKSIAHRQAKLRLRLMQHAAIAVTVVIFSLVMGTAGYWRFAGLKPLDGFLNASMLLAGMGPVDPITSPGGKLFASFYALYSGIVFLASAGLLLVPVFHHLLLSFRIEDVE